MASLRQISGTLGLCIRSNKIINAQPCISELHNKKSSHFSNLVATSKSTLFSLALVGHNKKPIIDLWKQCQNEKWKIRVGEGDEVESMNSLIKTTVENFYEAFNTREIEDLKRLLSDDCVYQDLLFYNPFKGHQEVINFLRNVMDIMGSNINIAVQDIKVEGVEEDNLTATVLWQLEWNKKKLPYTHGCRFFRFKKGEEGLIICEINGLEELPVKPGELVLNLLKAIRTFFDSYPPMARALLETVASQEDSTHDGSP